MVLLVVLALLMISFVSLPKDEYAEIVRFREDFTNYFGYDTSSISIIFVDEITAQSKFVFVGYCYAPTNSIEILRSYWKTIPTITKQMLIFHELGHCLLKKHHDPTLQNDTCGASIMLPHLDRQKCYVKHYNELIEEFKKPQT